MIIAIISPLLVTLLLRL